MASVRLSVHVHEPADVVWRAASDWPRQGEWMLGTEVHLTGGSGGPGSRLAAFTGLGGVGFLDTMEIVGWDPPRSCRVRHTGGLVQGEGGFQVTEVVGRRVVEQGTEESLFTWWEDFRLPPGGSLVWPFAQLGVTWGLRRSLDRFAQFCHQYRDAQR